MRTIEVKPMPVPSPRRQVFRQEAMRAYAEANNRPVLPRFTTPFAIACCWMLAILLAASTVLVFSAHVPLTTSGMAIVAGYGSDETVTVLVVLPPGSDAAVETGDEVILRFGGNADAHLLASVEEAPARPDAIAKRFGLDAETAGAIPPRSTIGVVRVEDLSFQISPSAVGRAEIEVGTQRVAAILPVVGRFFS